MFPRNRSRRLQQELSAAVVAVVLLCSAFAFAAPKGKSKADAGTTTVDAGVLFEPFVWDIPDIIEVIDVQGQMSSAGIPIRASAVRTKAKGEPLVMHIFKSFKRHGLFVPLPSTMTQIESLPQLTGYDTIRQVAYTAMFQSNPDGTTTLIVTEADVGARKSVTAQPARIPLPKDASKVVRSNVEGIELVSFSTRLQPAQVGDFYRLYAADAGMATNDESGESFAFKSAQGELTISAESKGDAGMHVTVIERRTAGQP